MSLRLYDTLTKEKRPFTPLDPANVRMYVCGPTVYDFAHIGNARPVIVFDVLFRLLRHVYGEDRVTYVRNITDVDDKINARAARDFPGLPLNDAIRQVTEKTEAQFHADVAALGCLPPTFEPRATERLLRQHHRMPRVGGYHRRAELDAGHLAADDRKRGERVVAEDLRGPESVEPRLAHLPRLLHEAREGALPIRAAHDPDTHAGERTSGEADEVEPVVAEVVDLAVGHQQHLGGSELLDELAMFAADTTEDSFTTQVTKSGCGAPIHATTP